MDAIAGRICGVTVVVMNRINVGDTYRLMGACQYATTRENISIRIEPYSTITKVRDTLFDNLFIRYMWRLNGTDWVVNINQSIIDRYFEKVDVKSF